MASRCEKEEVSAKLLWLHEQGLRAEKRRDLRLAIAAYEAALELAEQGNDALASHHLRWHLGSTQCRAARYGQAIAVLTPALLQSPPCKPDEADQVCPGMTGRDLRAGLMFSYVQAALERPVFPGVIQGCLDDFGAAIAEGFPEEEAVTMYGVAYHVCLADYLLSRGRFGELREVAEQARSKFTGSYRTTFTGLTAFALAETGDRAGALTFLERLRQGESRPSFWARQAEIVLARRAGNADLAVSICAAGRSDAEAEQFQRRTHRAEVAYVESALAAGDFAEAASALMRLRRKFSRESHPQRLDMLRLLGEYHLALARVVAGLPAGDCRYGGESAGFPRLENPEQAARQSGRALRWLTLATAKGALFDAASGTSYTGELRPRQEAAARLNQRAIKKTRPAVGKPAS